MSGEPLSRLDESVLPPPLSAREGQHRTPFTEILETLLSSCAGSLAAVLTDEEGECVDFAAAPKAGGSAVEPTMKAYDAKLCGACWQIAMRQARKAGGVTQLWVEASELGFVVQHLSEGYVLLLVCRAESLPAVSPRALRQCEIELAIEAGWDIPDPDRTCWMRTRVRLDNQGQPLAVWLAGRWLGEIEVSRAGLQAGSFERAYAMRQTMGATPAGARHGEGAAERTAENTHDAGVLELVREPSGQWYVGASYAAIERAFRRR